MITNSITRIFLISFSFIFCIASSNCYAKPKSSKMEIEIKYQGEKSQKFEAFSLVDSSLKKYGNFGVYGNLSQGLDFLLQENVIQITDYNTKYQVSISPKSGEGHDFAFQVDKKTAKISGLAVGEIIKDPKTK